MIGVASEISNDFPMSIWSTSSSLNYSLTTILSTIGTTTIGDLSLTDLLLKQQQQQRSGSSSSIPADYKQQQQQQIDRFLAEIASLGGLKHHLPSSPTDDQHQQTNIGVGRGDTLLTPEEAEDFLRNVSNALESLLPGAYLPHETLALLPLLTAYLLLVVAAVGGNLILCAAAARGRRLRTASGVFLANLAAADLLQALIGAPLTLARLLLNEWPFGDIGCKLVSLSQSCFVYGATLTMTAMALDRYRVVKCPLRPRPGPREGAIVTVVVWILSVVLALPHGVFHRIAYVWTLRKRERCQAWFPSPAEVWRQWFTVLTFVTQFVVPLLITVLAYVAVARRMVDRAALAPGSNTVLQRILVERQTRRTLIALMSAVVAFALCWLPINTYHLVADLGLEHGPRRHRSGPFLACHMVAVASAAINPIVYCWLDERVRHWARATLRKRICCFVCDGKFCDWLLPLPPPRLAMSFSATAMRDQQQLSAGGGGGGGGGGSSCSTASDIYCGGIAAGTTTTVANGGGGGGGGGRTRVKGHRRNVITFRNRAFLKATNSNNEDNHHHSHPEAAAAGGDSVNNNSSSSSGVFVSANDNQHYPPTLDSKPNCNGIAPPRVISF